MSQPTYVDAIQYGTFHLRAVQKGLLVMLWGVQGGPAVSFGLLPSTPHWVTGSAASRQHPFPSLAAEQSALPQAFLT